MIDIDFERLRNVGLTPALSAQAALLPEPDTGHCQLMRLTEVHRETVSLQTATGSAARASCRGWRAC